MEPSKFLDPEEYARMKKREVKPIEHLTGNIVKTKISVTEAHLLRLFLDANDMGSFVIGYFTDYDDPLYSHMKAYGVNNLCYSMDGSNFLIESNLMHMKIKYGSLEKAFNEFRKEYRNQI